MFRNKKSQSQIPPERRYELEKLADKSVTTAVLYSLIVTPIGYWYVGEKLLALINLITMNYFLTGFVIVPLHTRKIIKDARKELKNAPEPDDVSGSMGH